MALKLGHTTQNFQWECDGEAPTYLTKFTPPSMSIDVIEQATGPDVITKKMQGGLKHSTAKASVNVGSANSMYEWVAAVWNKAPIERSGAVVLANQNYEVQRRIDMMGCLIKSVSFPALDAKDGKKFFDMDIEFQPEDVKYDFSKGSKVQSTMSQKAKNWTTANFRIEIPGLDCSYVTKVDLPKWEVAIAAEHHGQFRLPIQYCSAPKLTNLSVTFSAHGFDQVAKRAMKELQDGKMNEEDHVTIGITMLDQSHSKELGAFTFEGCALSKFDWVDGGLEGGKDSQATCKVEFYVESGKMEIKHK